MIERIYQIDGLGFDPLEADALFATHLPSLVGVAAREWTSYESIQANIKENIDTLKYSFSEQGKKRLILVWYWY